MNGPVVAPHRLRVVRFAVGTGAFAVVVVEAAGALGALNGPTIAACWALVLVIMTVMLIRRPGWREPVGRAGLARLRSGWAAADRVQRLMVVVTGGLILAELAVALLAEPNNFDSQTYHLSRIEHWVAAEDVNFFATAIHRQVTLAPGGEFLLAHLRLLTGSDALYNLVQWAMGVLCVLVGSRICAQFGGSGRAQLLTAFAVATTPMVVLQATSTQVDLIVAGWVACLVTLVLDGVRTRVNLAMVGWLGAAAGLAAVTKATGMLAAGVLLLLWGVGQLRAHRSVGGAGQVLAASLGVLAVAALLVGPFLARTYHEFGTVLGAPHLHDSITMQQHDPASIGVNALRIGHTALDTPLGALNRAGATTINGIAAALGVDANAREITFGRTTFPVPAWYPDEDRVAAPLQGTLALLAAGFCLVRPRRFTDRPQLLRGYVGAVALALLLYVSIVKWQPWGNRLILFTLILAAPLIGLWLDQVLARKHRLSGRVVIAGLAVVALSATLTIGYGFPRRLVGTGAVSATDALDTRFLRRPQWKDDFVAVSAAIEASGARRIGLVQQNDNWEYPWWVLLRGRVFVPLQSVFASRPPADPHSVDAIVCTGDMQVCRHHLPTGWVLVEHGYAAYALPPAD
ncbi:hypothetical protein [Catellatospora sichuanensis]|uniref:hypothetical protein n=1 Tax=Catellatospora sichuanensis TaxID=1969805 RepID=UPI0016433176|nr:hypothetical protein [Catellatospora sichuanensis]